MTGSVTVIASVMATTLLLGARAYNRRRFRLAMLERPVRALGPNGLVIGAEPVRLDGTGERSVLLLHGFNDTPQSVETIARALHGRGWSVVVPLLPHHGRTDDENARLGNADEWIASARTEWQALGGGTGLRALAGQSMGGAIAAILAAEQRPAALVLLAPYLEMGAVPRILSTVWPVTAIALPEIVSDPKRGIRDERERAKSLSNGHFTPRMLNELRRVVSRSAAALHALRAPTLVIQGRADYRIPSTTAQRAFDRIGATDKTLVWLQNVGHVIAADAGSTDVGVLVADWLDAKVIR